VIVLRFELDPDARLVTFDPHALAPLHPRASYPVDPIEELVPARLDLTLVEASKPVFERGLQAPNINSGRMESR
jgi:hypothetical protein